MAVSNDDHPLRILLMAAEAVPYSKTRQVADVVGALARSLARLGHDVRLALPRYDHVDIERFGLTRIGDPIAVPMANRTDEAIAYQAVTPEGVTVYMLDNPRHFGAQVTATYSSDAEPFIFYARSVLEMMCAPWFDWQPDVVHCHDWQTAIVPNWLATLFSESDAMANVCSVFTIHRLSHQGIFGYRVLEVAGIREFGYLYHSAISDLGEMVDLMARGIHYANAITTVSETYAREIQTPEFGERLDPLLRDCSDRLFGILNGIDVDVYNPATDGALHRCYDLSSLDVRSENKTALQQAVRLPEVDVPVIGMVARLVEDKGIGLLVSCLDALLRNTDAQLVIVGVGEPRYHEVLASYMRLHPRRLAAQFTFDETLERQLYAGSDMFLMPSLVEPCGLGHMLAMRYGSVPIVHATGGLADTVVDYAPRRPTSTGFSFAEPDSMALYAALIRAIEVCRHRDLWRGLQERCMQADFSWQASAQTYVDVYRWACTMHQRNPRPQGGWVG